ncbi:asparaginase [bacterium 1xD42-67]|nr:asparaginase [bacterium 1xD42-67]
MKNILLLNTGGTFSSRPGDHGLSPELTSGDICNLIGEFNPALSIVAEDYCSLDSSNITPDDWQRLALRIGEKVGFCDGVVLIHGTDTLAYTSSMLSYMLQNIPVPVVITGSQMPLGVPMSDAADNLRCALQMAASGYGGVFVAFDRKIMLGCRTSKVRTVSFNAFESINYPHVGEVNAFGLQLHLERVQSERPFQVQAAYSDRIAVLKLFPGMDPDIFRFLQEHGYEGLYIEGFGLGGVPFLKSDFTAEIRRASQSGLPILVGSQCRYEGSNLNVYETGQRILECGGIPVHDMTYEAVVTKLMWCLGQAKDRETVQRLFQRAITREVSFS